MATIIPMFPLSHVLLPGSPLPLHIFEQRYRDLVDDCEAAAGPGAQPAFGVVALRTGTEALTRHVAEAGPDVEELGTLAEIVDIERAEDGTSDLLCVGTRRFRVRRLITDGTAYLRAEVDFLAEDDADVTVEQEQRVRDLLDVYDTALRRLAGRATGSELPSEAGALSYQVAARLPLPPAERQALLGEPTTGVRLTQLARLLRREIALLRGTRSIAVSPATLRLVTGIN